MMKKLLLISALLLLATTAVHAQGAVTARLAFINPDDSSWVAASGDPIMSTKPGPGIIAKCYNYDGTRWLPIPYTDPYDSVDTYKIIVTDTSGADSSWWYDTGDSTVFGSQNIILFNTAVHFDWAEFDTAVIYRIRSSGQELAGIIPINAARIAWYIPGLNVSCVPTATPDSTAAENAYTDGTKWGAFCKDDSLIIYGKSTAGVTTGGYINYHIIWFDEVH